MTSIHDLAIDLINEARLASQSDKKLYKLEQVKEIIFHRDKTLLPLILPEIFELMLDQSAAVRRFLVRLAGDALQETQTVTPDVISLFSFLIVDGNDRLLESIAQILSKKYDIISITIALMTPKTAALYQQPHSQQQQCDPKDLWYQFRTVCSTLIDCIGAQKSDKLRCQCLKLCEQVVLFALLHAGGSVSSLHDPRLRQTSTGLKSVQEISMHHAFINRLELEKEADSLLAKMVLWARRGGSQYAPFSPAVQCCLGQVLATVATERPGALRQVVPALNYLLQGGEGGVCAQMTAAGRQLLSVSILRLLRVAQKALSAGPVGEQEQLQQLREAASRLDDSCGAAVGGGSANQSRGSSVVSLLSGVRSSDPRKRKLEEMAAAAASVAQQKADSLKEKEGSGAASGFQGEEGTEEQEEEEEGVTLNEESIRRSALSAVEARLQSSQPAKRTKVDALLQHLTGTVTPPSPSTAASGPILPPPPAPSSSAGGTHPTPSHPHLTSLAADLGDLPKASVGNSLRLVSLVLPSSDSADSSEASVAHLQSIPPPAEVYADLSLGSLAGLVNRTVHLLPQQSSHMCLLSSPLELKLALRMMLSMAATDFDQHRAFLQQLASKVVGSGSVTRQTVQHVALLKTRGRHETLLRGGGEEGKLSSEVPKDVLLPRTLWLMLSHALVGQESFHAVLVEGLSTSASASSAKHQAAEIIRKANTGGASSRHGQFASGQKFDHMDLIILLLREIYIRKVANSEGAVVGIPGTVTYLCTDDAAAHQGDGDGDGSLYESLCLAALSRTLQRRILRPCAGRLLHHLPRVPVQCIQLLELLLLTGSKPAGTPSGGSAGRQQGAGADRGTRLAALEILGSLLFSSVCMQDPAVFFRTLCPLLWLSVSEDLSTRSSAVNCLVGACRRIERDHSPGEGLYHVRSTILLFALQAALHCTGTVGMFSQVVKVRESGQAREVLAARAPSTPSADLLGFVRSSTWSGLSGENGDGEGAEDKEGHFVDVDDVFAAECYDRGASFGGRFCPPPDSAKDNELTENYIKRHFQLLSQLCANRHTLLSVFFGIYEVSLSCTPEPSLCMRTVRMTVEKEVLGIVPLLLPARPGFSRQKHSALSAASPEDIVSHLAAHCNLTATLPLFCLALERSLEPVSMPASEGMLLLGRDLVSRLAPAPGNICVLLPLLGGMTAAAVEEILPRVVRDLCSPDFAPLLTTPSGADVGIDEEGLKEKQVVLKNTFLRKAFHRITHTRPPPLSRARLLAALHRVDPEKEEGLKLKQLLDAIGLCIAEKEEYSAEVLKEALLLLLLEDPVPPDALMRTVLLAAQTLPEMQRFALLEVIPRLVRKKTWLVAPKVWEGVLMCVKTFNSQRDFEPTIRAFVGLPMAQLKSVITIAKDVKGILNRVLRSLSSADIEECASGRWAGIEDLNIAQSAKDKEEKDSFIKSILQK